MTARRSDRREQRRLNAAERLANSKRRLCGHMHVQGGADCCPTIKLRTVAMQPRQAVA